MRHRTESLSIPPAVKQAVARRDSVDGHPCCILCGDPAPPDAPTAYSCAHYISRGQGGLGIEENILTLCPECHRLYDGEERQVFRPILNRYLREHYTNWTEDALYYKK